MANVERNRFVPDFADRNKYSNTLNDALAQLDAVSNNRRSKELRQRRALEHVHPTEQILSRLHHPQRHLKTVHVTGSKGKGSTSAMIAAALQTAPFSEGRTIGFYNSPHLDRINERVRLNGKPVGDDVFVEAINEALDARKESPVVECANRWNVLFASALRIFEKQNCAWSVVEVGIGGRTDATNVISAPVSLITNIYLEHADVIGPTLEDIAFEKAGVIAPGADVVVGMDATDKLAHIFKKEAAELNPPARVLFMPHEEGATIFEQNLKLSRAVMAAIARREGMAELSEEEFLPKCVAQRAVNGLGGRTEYYNIPVDGCKVQVVVDITHVAESIDLVLRELQMSVGRGYDCRRPVVVIGLGRDKSVDRIASVLRNHGIQCVGTCAIGKSDVLAVQDWSAEAMSHAGITESVSFDSARDVLNWAVRLAKRRETYVVMLGGKMAALGRSELLVMSAGSDESA